MDRNKLIEDHVSYAEVIASKYGRERHLPLDHGDLISLGMLGLVKAACGYEEQENVKFKSYAWRRIRGEIQDYVRHEMRSRRKTPKPVISSLEEMIETRMFNPSIFSTNGTEEKVINRELVEKILTRLSEQNAFVLEAYYLRELRMWEIAAILGVTAGRVSQIHAKALIQARKVYSHRL